MIPRGARRVKLPRAIRGETDVVFRERAIGIKVEQDPDSACVVVKSFHDIKAGQPSPAQAAGVRVGDALLSISGESVEFLTYKTLLKKIRSAGRPLKLRFAKWEEKEEGGGSGNGGGGGGGGGGGSSKSVLFSSLAAAMKKRDGGRDLESGAAASSHSMNGRVGMISLPPKVYTGRSLGNDASKSLRDNERRCAVFGVFLLMLASLLLFFRVAGSGVNRETLGNNLAYATGGKNKLGNVTSVDGNKVTIILSGKEHTGFLKHHFHHTEGGEDDRDGR
jgi:hypothetical protein